MKILILPAGDSAGSAAYRLAFPATVLIQQDHDITVSHDDNPLGIEVDGNTVVSVAECEYDLIVAQRPMTRVATQVTKILQSRGVAVVIELDDDFWSLNPNNDYARNSRNRDNNVHHLSSTLHAADLVTVSTPHLATVVPVEHSKVRVLRNCVPLFYTEIDRDPSLAPDLDPDRLTVGWTGTPGTHSGDLEETRYAVRDIVRETNAQFYTIGDERTPFVLGFDDAEAFWSPWTIFTKYIYGVKNFDVGIAPLKHNTFSLSKSCLKGLEYAALGIPFVASDMPEYEWLYDLGAGNIARHEGEWRKYLRELLTSPQARFEQRAAGRQAARELSYEKNAWLWLEAWNEAIERRKRGK